MNGELAFDFRTYRRFSISVIGKKIWLMRSAGVLLVVISILNLVYGNSDTWDVFYVFLGLFLSGFYDLFIVLCWRRQIAFVTEPMHYVIDDSTVRIQTPKTDVTLRWEAITKARVNRDGWVLKLANKQSVAIPRAAFSVDDARRIDSLVDSLHRTTRN